MPQREYHFYVYILASRSRSLYVGFTNDIRLRIKQHREKRPGSHTAKYNIGRLVYYEHFTYVLNAIAREKELKDWNRARKITLVDENDPTWEDLAAEWQPRFVSQQRGSLPFVVILRRRRRTCFCFCKLPVSLSSFRPASSE
jgi:putative endonuclease